MLEHDTSVRGSGSWPTPNKFDAVEAWSMCDPVHWEKRRAGHARKGVNLQFPLRVAAQNGSTLGTRGRLNPPWVEWLMGWPIGWTELKPSATAKFQQWLQWHGVS
jgi:hypothetical protein